MKAEEFHIVKLVIVIFSVANYASGHKPSWSLYTLSAKSNEAHRNYLVLHYITLHYITKQSALRS